MKRGTLILLLFLTLVGGAIRFFQLSEPDEITGDEVYFVNFSRAYVNQEYFFDVHPPLGKMINALGQMLFGNRPIGWRFMPALFGTLLIPLAYWLGKIATGKNFVGLGLSLITAFDGLLFVESRLGLINIIYLTFLVVAYACMFQCLHSLKTAIRWLILGGIFLGLAVSTKWVAWFAVPPMLMFVIFFYQLDSRPPVFSLVKRLWLASLILIVLPLLISYLVWLFHFYLVDSEGSFLINQIKIFQYHTGISETHAYQSPWWSWLLLWRPFPHLIESDKTVKIITGLGNPAIWWPAIVIVLASLKRQVRQKASVILILIALFFHLATFGLVSRPMFLYHALPAFYFLGILGLNGAEIIFARRKYQCLAVWAVFVILVFWVFYPIYTGQELSQSSLQLREWLPGWLH
ncbi:MAG: phospholipid carrier-dependent glycosyltransferase [bacterium]